jgi:hypothetical protein
LLVENMFIPIGIQMCMQVAWAVVTTVKKGTLYLTALGFPLETYDLQNAW